MQIKNTSWLNVMAAPVIVAGLAWLDMSTLMSVQQVVNPGGYPEAPSRLMVTQGDHLTIGKNHPTTWL